MPASRYDEALLSTFAGGEYEAFLDAGGLSLRARHARALELARVSPGMRLVDVGCGRGEVAAHAALRGARVTAVDFSRDALAMSRRTRRRVAEGHGFDEADLVVDGVAAEASRLPLRSGSADRVLLLDVVEHLIPLQLAELLGEVRRILAPGGLVVIHTLPNAWALALAYPALRALAPALPAEPRSEYERVVHVNEQSPRSLRAALRRAGLDNRVWVEEWSTRQAAASGVRRFPDDLRRTGYAALRRPFVAWLAGRLMRTPLAPFVGNDIFAVAWLGREPRPSSSAQGL